MSPHEGTLRRRWYPANEFLNSPGRRGSGVLKRLGAALQGLPDLRAERFVTAVNQRRRIPTIFATPFASHALPLGESIPLSGKLLGHGDIETTARYVHLPKESFRETAERITQNIAADIL